MSNGLLPYLRPFSISNAGTCYLLCYLQLDVQLQVTVSFSVICDCMCRCYCLIRLLLIPVPALVLPEVVHIISLIFDLSVHVLAKAECILQIHFLQSGLVK
jgi:hypothetical protein